MFRHLTMPEQPDGFARRRCFRCACQSGAPADSRGAARGAQAGARAVTWLRDWASRRVGTPAGASPGRSSSRGATWPRTLLPPRSPPTWRSRRLAGHLHAVLDGADESARNASQSGERPMSTDNVIELEHYYSHPPAAVWRALTTPELHARWWTAGDVKPVVGHKFELDMGHWGKQSCEVLAVEPERLISYVYALGVLDTT